MKLVFDVDNHYFEMDENQLLKHKEVDKRVHQLISCIGVNFEKNLVLKVRLNKCNKISVFVKNKFYDERKIKITPLIHDIVLKLTDIFELEHRHEQFRKLVFETNYEVRNILESLKNKNVCVVHGVPSSGKKELLRIALRDNFEFYDLLVQFQEKFPSFQAYTSEENIPKRIEWIRENRDAIIDQLVNSPNKTIIFSEFDVGKKEALTSEEVDFMNEVLDIAKEVKKQKQVVLIVHNKGVNVPSLVKRLQEDFQTAENQIVLTNYLSKEQELKLLEKLPWTEMKKFHFARAAQGLPTAYTYLLKEKNSIQLSPEDLLSRVKKLVENSWKVTQVNSPPHIVNLLLAIAKQKIDCNGNECRKYQKELLQTGLFAKRGTRCYMSPLVVDVIQKKGSDIPFSEVVEVDLRKEHPFLPVDFKKKDETRVFMESEFKACRKVVESLGGGRVLELMGEKFVYPENPALVTQELRKIREMIKERINYTKQTDVQAAVALKNTATSVDELVNLAEKQKGEFISFCQNVTSRTTSGFCHFGPHNKYVTKSKKSLARKVESWWREVQQNRANLTMKDIVQSANDVLRGTIVVKSPEEVGQILRHLETEAANKGWSIEFRNHWDSDRASGYVGVHGTLQMQSKNGETILAEIQIHLSEIYDGSELCVKEMAHFIYEYARTAFTADYKGALEKKDDPRFFANQICRLLYLTHLYKVE